MTGEEKELLQTFEARVRHFILLHEELKHENAKLKELLQEKEVEMKGMLADYKKLQTDYANLKAGATISLTGSDVRDTKLRLSRLVREIDKCIALLND